MTNNPVFESALKLPLAERYQLVEAILDSMDTPNPQVEKAWAKVADDRWAAYQRGEISAIPAKELLDQLRAAS
jgi:putative addiction module component (TIGR02574 family)